MSDAPAYEPRLHAREAIILDDRSIERLGEQLGFTQHHIGAIQTVCFWLRWELPAEQVSLEDLLAVFDNPSLRHWFYDLHPGCGLRRFEQVCHDFIMQCSPLVDEMVATF